MIIFYTYLFGSASCLWKAKHCNQFQKCHGLSPSAELTFEQLNKIFEDEKQTDRCAWEVEGNIDGQEVLNPDNSSSQSITVLNWISNEFQYECLGEADRLLNVCPICQLNNVQFSGNEYSISGLPEMMSLLHQCLTMWSIVRRWVLYWDMPGALVTDDMALRKSFNLVAASMICMLRTWKDVVGLPTVDIMGESPWHISEYGTESLSWHYRGWTCVVSIAENEFSTWLPFQDAGNTCSAAPWNDFRCWPIWGCHRIWRGWDIQECHQQDEIWDQLQTGELVGPRNCESDQWRFKHQHWQAREPMACSACFI